MLFENDYLYALALCKIDGIGNINAKRLIDYFGSAEKVFAVSDSQRLKVENIGEVTTKNIRQYATQALKAAEQELKKLSEIPQSYIWYYRDSHYPKRLREIPDCPILFFSQGKVDWEKKAIAIVGTRSATEYGKQLTERLIQDLKPYNPLIISGLAYGIDITAHKICLKYEISTIGVMATGLNKIYPQIHKKTALQIVEQGGALITENYLDTPPDAMRFPARNRIIAGLADAVVVVEARSTGGALITAEIANSYNREVLAFPGNVGSKASEGCNNLIKQHKAHLITHAQDLIEFLSWDLEKIPKKQEKKNLLNEATLETLTSTERRIIALLQDYHSQNKDLSVDEISIHLELSHSSLNAALLNLEILGIVKALPGRYFRLV
ncbi:MAG: DNA-processing protein DprA [Microscillaceae bacterium]|nr:DNA-processing protein DprA [Microscillaceae bacterium]MDW8460811.1 DNA-processing protein DprA [Cytophagales bacterium]